MLRFFHSIFAVALIGCSPNFTETEVEPGQTVRVNQALYVEEPQILYTAFRNSCDGPGSQYKELGPNGAQCRLAPTPDVAAELLLRFDGDLGIPYYFIERRTQAASEGFVVTLDYFASVPLKNGKERRVYLRSKRLDRQIDQMFVQTGGTPI